MTKGARHRERHLSPKKETTLKPARSCTHTFCLLKTFWEEKPWCVTTNINDAAIISCYLWFSSMAHDNYTTWRHHSCVFYLIWYAEMSTVKGPRRLWLQRANKNRHRPALFALEHRTSTRHRSHHHLSKSKPLSLDNLNLNVALSYIFKLFYSLCLTLYSCG